MNAEVRWLLLRVVHSSEGFFRLFRVGLILCLLVLRLKTNFIDFLLSFVVSVFLFELETAQKIKKPLQLVGGKLIENFSTSRCLSVN
jgi:hypothetical protein